MSPTAGIGRGLAALGSIQKGANSHGAAYQVLRKVAPTP